jgi:hypothetical protein
MAKRKAAKRTTAKKTTRRGRARARFTSARKSPQARIAGRTTKNLIVGSAVLNITSRLAGPQTARAGIYAQPLNLILAGLGSTSLGISSQKDLVSAGIKIAGSRAISTQVMPRLQELSTRGGPSGSGRMNQRDQGYGT